MEKEVFMKYKCKICGHEFDRRRSVRFVKQKEII